MFAPNLQPRALTAFGPVLGASAALGPIVAGFLISADIAGLSWRPIFLISASGSLSAVQQLAAAVGSAVVTTVYFTQLAHHGAAHAMTVSVAVVGAIALLGLAWLLPRSAPPDQP